MTAERFTLRWMWLFAIFAALVALMPLLVAFLNRNAGCFHSDHACSDMADLLFGYGRALILAAVLIPLLVAVAARALTAGLFAWAFPFSLLMTAGSLPLLNDLGGPDADSISDIMSHPSLPPFLFLMVLLFALGAGSEDHDGKLWRILMGAVAVLSVFVISAAWLPGFSLMPVVGQAAGTIGNYLGAGQNALGMTQHVGQLTNSCLIGFALGAAGLMMSARHARG